jgi:hypothetical protein
MKEKNLATAFTTFACFTFISTGCTGAYTGLTHCWLACVIRVRCVPCVAGSSRFSPLLLVCGSGFRAFVVHIVVWIGHGESPVDFNK